MTRTAIATGLALVLGAGWADAQERPRSDEQPYEEAFEAEEPEAGDQAALEDERPEPRRRIRVLRDPYDIASFYRSRQGTDFFGQGYGQDPRGDRYPIAGYYRSRQVAPYGGPGFWDMGYGDRRARPGLVIGFRHSIGENGDLFLFAPTFLSPLGPLTDLVFFGR